MKKLLSLVLVAMLLVCAVPFQAAAAEDAENLTVKTYVDGKYVTDKHVSVKPGDSLTLTKELAETLIEDNNKEFVKWTNMKDEETTGPISYDNLKKANADGYYVNLILKKKAAEDTRVDAKVPVEIYVDGSYARKGTWTDEHDASYTADIQKRSGVRKLSQNRYAFSFEYKQDGWTVRSEYIHSTGKAFAKSITNFNDANAKDCNLNAKIGNKAQGVYGLVIAPLAQLPKNSRIDVKARYDMYQPNGKSNMQRTQYEAGLNFHIGKRISILTEYALINDKTLAKHNYSMADAEVCFRF